MFQNVYKGSIKYCSEKGEWLGAQNHVSSMRKEANGWKLFRNWGKKTERSVIVTNRRREWKERGNFKAETFKGIGLRSYV